MLHVKRPVFMAVLAAILAVSLLAAGCQQKAPDAASPEPVDPDPSSGGEPGEENTDLESIGLLDLMDVTWFTFAEPIEGDTSPQVEWRHPDEDTVIYYVFDRQAMQYSGFRTPRPQSATLLQLVLSMGVTVGFEYPDYPLPVNSVWMAKTMVILDLDGDAFREKLPDEAEGNRVLASIARTLIQSDEMVYDVGFTMDGGQQFVTDYLTLEGDGYGRYDCPPLYAQVSDAQYAAIRESLPYPGLGVTRTAYDGLGYNSFADEAVKNLPGAEKAALLLHLAGYAGTDFDNPGQIPNDVKVNQALAALPIATSMEAYKDTNDYYYAQLAPISQAVNDSEITPREWVERAIKDLYGPDATVIHQTLNRWQWHAREGVYTPPHMGGWGAWAPYVFDVEDLGDSYRVELVYIRLGMGGGFGDGETWVEPTVPSDYFDGLDADPKFHEFVARQPRKEAILMKDGDSAWLKSVKTL